MGKVFDTPKDSAKCLVHVCIIALKDVGIIFWNICIHIIKSNKKWFRKDRENALFGRWLIPESETVASSEPRDTTSSSDYEQGKPGDTEPGDFPPEHGNQIRSD